MKSNNFIKGIWALFLFCGCNSFLEEKPDIKMVIPKSLEDAELLLNNYSVMNTGYPLYGEWGADEYYTTDAILDGALNLDQRNTYTWADQPYIDVVQWQMPYRVIFNSNQVLDILNNLDKNTYRINEVSGKAYFFRAFAFQQLTEVFAPTYRPETAKLEMGIPLRLDPGIDEPSIRASLQESYDQIIKDYKMAVRNLPLTEVIKGRPFRASAYAGLARAYLVMGDYQLAYNYADSCLQTHAELMDFNTLSATDNLPIPKFNEEVLFAAVTGSAGAMTLNYGLVDSTLSKSYTNNDLRKLIFFRKNPFPKDSYSYKGSYDKSNATLFVGLTTSEMYLIKAESAVRIGKINEALFAVNTLLKKRQDKDKFIPIIEINPDVLLPLILIERQKELLFRGRRWSDLKRLNLEPRFKKTLTRVVHGTEYILEPNSHKYAFRLPDPVVTIGKIPQNIR